MAQLLLSLRPPSGATHLNQRFAIGCEADIRVVFAAGQPVVSFHVNDTAARDLAIVQLCEHGGLSEAQVAEGFQVSRPTVSRAKKKYATGGVPALVPQKRGPRTASKLKGAKEKAMLRLARNGSTKVEIATRLGVNESTVRKALQRMGLPELAVRQHSLLYDEAEATEATPDAEPQVYTAAPEHKASAAPQATQMPSTAPEATQSKTTNVVNHSNVANTEPETFEHGEAGGEPGAMDEQGRNRSDDVDVPVESSSDTDPENRVVDRCFARLGLLCNAAPLFANRQKVSWAGLLLALPILVSHHVIKDAVDTFDEIGPAFYGRLNSILSCLLLFLSRIGRPEALKEHPPAELGAVLGLDRFPEMKTLRRKIAALSKQNKSLQFMKLLTERHLKRTHDAHVWLYVDGHVSVYSGKHKLKKEHVTRLRISLPAILDYWINDDRGDPLMVVTAVPKKSIKTLLPKLVSELRELGEQRPVTLVFDREGWSPEMFATLDELQGVKFLTYRKAQANKGLPRLAVKQFELFEQKSHGQRVSYHLADKGIYVKYGNKTQRKQLHLRQVTRQTADGHQTHIITNDWKLGTFEVADRMFRRWGQENFFKYMRREMELDGLYTYAMDDGDGERLVPNPKRKALAKKITKLDKHRDKLTKEYGQRALTNQEQRRRTMRGFKTANGSLRKDIAKADAEIKQLREQHSALPAMVPVKETLNEEKMLQVRVETRRLMHCFRIAAYRAESALRELVRPNYQRWRQDGRTIIQSMLHSAGAIEVQDNELRVTLEPQSAPHRTRALDALCQELNKLNTRFPGSDLQMRFGVRAHESVS